MVIGRMMGGGCPWWLIGGGCNIDRGVSSAPEKFEKKIGENR